MCMPANDKTIPSLIKWTGSKRKQAPLIAREAKSYNRYFEPFLGGGALLFLFAHEGAVASDGSPQRVIAHGYHLVITLVTLRHRDGSLTIHVGNNTLWRLQFLVVGVGDDCADDWLLGGFVEDTELHLSLCSDREGEYQQ